MSLMMLAMIVMVLLIGYIVWSALNRGEDTDYPVDTEEPEEIPKPSGDDPGAESYTCHYCNERDCVCHREEK